MNTKIIDDSITFYRKRVDFLLEQLKNKSIKNKKNIKKELLHLKTKIEWEVSEIVKYIGADEEETP